MCLFCVCIATQHAFLSLVLLSEHRRDVFSERVLTHKNVALPLMCFKRFTQSVLATQNITSRQLREQTVNYANVTKQRSS